jgi:hypothetical protein
MFSVLRDEQSNLSGKTSMKIKLIVGYINANLEAVKEPVSIVFYTSK